MRFERLDLNLLVALDALLAERSVARAADRICLSPSATSSVLGRLRDYFGDDLLTLKGRQMVLTRRGEELIEPVRHVLDLVKTTIATKPAFVPAQSDRRITLMASDYVGDVLLSQAILRFAERAPNMTFSILPITDRPIRLLEQGAVDVVLTLDFALVPDYPSRPLFRDDYVVAGWADNPLLQEGMDADLYFSMGHVTTQFGESRKPGFEDWFVQRCGRLRRVEVIAPSFLSVPRMIVGTHRIATIYRRFAEQLAKTTPLTLLPVPFAMPEVRVGAQWHPSSDGDHAVRWVVEELQALSAELDMAAQVPRGAALVEKTNLSRAFQSAFLN